MHLRNHLNRFLVAVFSILALTGATAYAQLTGTGTVAISAAGTTSPATQDFNTLANTGTSSTLPTGWYFLEVGTSANNTYAAGTGSSNAGNTYSFGAASSSERAIGAVASGSQVARIGAQLVNNSGGVLTSITIAYTGEEWRRGTLTNLDDGLAFSYSTSATGLDDAFTWTTVPALSFNSPHCGVTADVATDGNSAACRTAISATISGLNILPNTTVWIRWSDSNNTGNDDGVAIDDVTITAAVAFVSTNPTATGSASPNPVNPGGTTTLSGSILQGFNPASVSYSISCNLTTIGGSATQALAVTGSTFTYLASVSPGTGLSAYSLPCSVTDDQSRTSNFSISLTVLLPLSATCGTTATPINIVQGSGATSPLVGSTVDLEGIVVGAFQGATQLNGFYLEEPTATQDGNLATSEGIFVFANTPTVNVGDRVRIRGVVTEFTSSTGGLVSNLTELGTTSNATVCSTGNPLPAPVTLTLPVTNYSDFERYEGMLVQVNQQLYVTGNFALGSFDQIDIAPSVLYQPTQTVGNAGTWAAALDLINRSKIALDDASTLSNGTTAQNLFPTLFPTGGLTAVNTLRIGAKLPATFTGIFDDRFGEYRIQRTQTLAFDNSSNPRPDTAAISTALGGRFKLASANVLNFFTTLGSRGAATASELTNQRTKIIAELSKMGADAYGISEVQNFANGNTNGVTYTDAAASDLTTNLATATGRNYQFIDTIIAGNIVGGDITQNGTDAIRSVIIYDAGKLAPLGQAALYYQNGGHRPSIAQTFRPVSGAKADQQTFTFVVNHIRSKSSTCGPGDDDLYQGNCNGTRTSMTNAIKSWLSTNPTADPAGANRKIVMLGDFNAYYGEDPIQALVGSGGYTDLINLLIGANGSSYNFGSQNGYLDHGLANAAALPLVKGVVEIHNNSDEPSSLEALGTNAKPAAAIAAWFSPDEYAASDHDPFLIAFNPLAGDLNDDGVVDLADRNIIVANYGKPASQVDRRMDYDGDGTITPNDYRIWFNFYRAFIQ